MIINASETRFLAFQKAMFYVFKLLHQIPKKIIL